MDRLFFSDITDILTPPNSQLRDRFVNIKLSKTGGYLIDSYDDIIINTPIVGMKPDITVSGTLQLGENITTITVTLVNIDGDIDFNQYNYITVSMGYMSSGFSRAFYGEIINIYMAKPNPNGELVITMANADLISMNKTNRIKLQFNNDYVTYKSMLTQFQILNPGHSITIGSIPAEWETVTMFVGKAVYTFENMMEVVHWMNNMFMSVKDVKPILLHIAPVNDGKSTRLFLSGMYAKNEFTPVLKTLSCISSAFMAGTEYATVTAPWNPEISPGEFINIDTKYFKTRVNVAKFAASALEAQSNIWQVTNVQFTFSTRTTNTMTVQLTNVNNKNLVQEWN